MRCIHGRKYGGLSPDRAAISLQWLTKTVALIARWARPADGAIACATRDDGSGRSARICPATARGMCQPLSSHAGQAPNTTTAAPVMDAAVSNACCDAMRCDADGASANRRVAMTRGSAPERIAGALPLLSAA
ncbi:hypothetical protein XMIN_841 [Xanthomonas citri pv. mangiferaeindicae LMG 941]|nr:hypothetical protein XMIN_841 [Xanthomonas citri pv. mangiferaeindicae LMG 941]